MKKPIFLIQQECILCKQDFIDESCKTQDISLFELCNDKELQYKLNFIFNLNTHSQLASYLAQCHSMNPKEQQLAFDYLMTNPILRILWLNN